MNENNLPPPVDRYSYTQYARGDDGKLYRWDPDFAKWYHELSAEEWEAQSHWQKFDWIYWIIGLSVLCFIVEAYK